MRRPPASERRTRAGRAPLPARGERAGFVMLAVLVVLLLLLILSAPFLTTARNAEAAGASMADRAQARVALDTAERHARAHLGQSHPALDPTPYWDTPEELVVRNTFEDDFLDARDARGVMWDLEVRDEAGRVDLDSASPHMLANLMGLHTRLRAPLTDGATEMEVYDLAPFEDSGVVWVDGELIAYSGKDNEEGPKLVGLTRGLGAWQDEEDNWGTDGPSPPRGHGIGAHVLDQRAFALTTWRTATPDGEPRQLDSVLQFPELQEYVLDGLLRPGHLELLAQLGTVHGDVAAGRVWQHPARLISAVEAEQTYTIRVDDPRPFGPGSTVRVSDGQVSELRTVARVQGGGALVLDHVLQFDYLPYRAEVRALARRPVNLNSAPSSVLIALLDGLQLRGRNDRISTSEAAALAQLIEASRPLTGLQDLLERVVLPAAGLAELPPGAPPQPLLADPDATLIDEADASALYINALNASDARLAFSTMPFGFTSREVYSMELRAAVNAPSGAERVTARRERTQLVTPQGELMRLFLRQEDLEEATRLDRESPWWMTGPEAVVRWDGGSVPPSRFLAHMGSIDGSAWVPGFTRTPLDDSGEPRTPDRVFPDRGEQAFAQLWPARVPEEFQWQGRTLHFDHETQRLEGRYLPDQPVVEAADGDRAGWADPNEGMLMRALQLGFWIEPRTLGDATWFDLAGQGRENDRVTLAVEGPDLVLRVLDAFGDHPDTTEVEQAEVRYAIGSGDGPGLPADVWNRIDLDVAGTRPDQVDLLVNGLAFGVRRLGLSSTTAAVDGSSGYIPLESVEGFPAVGVARMGNELIEYTLDGNGLRAQFEVAGPRAGFGGRLARERHDVENPAQGGVSIPVRLSNGTVTTSYPPGTPVSVYGYSRPLDENLPAGSAALPDALGVFRVGRVVDFGSGPMDPIFAGPYQTDWGKGLERNNLPALKIQSADSPGQPDSSVLEAFHRSGGYAALVQVRWSAGPTPADSRTSETEAPLGGVEIVRYSGWSGDTLQLAARGDQVQAELQSLGAVTEMLGGSRAFVFEWRAQVEMFDVPAADTPHAATYVVPISLGVPGATDLNFLPPLPQRSEFAQITREDQAELTEWVRYDEIQSAFGQLVRSEPGALLNVHRVLTSTADVQPGDRPDLPTPGGGGGGPGGGGGFGGAGGGGMVLRVLGQPRARTVGRGAAGVTRTGPRTIPLDPDPEPSYPTLVAGVNWEPTLGTDELTTFPLSRAVHSALHFRGVLGTHSHAHPAGVTVVPVWSVPDAGDDAGRPGAWDSIFLTTGEPSHPGWPVTVHRSHLAALSRVGYDWTAGPDLLQPPADAGATYQVEQPQFFGRLYVALRQGSPEAIAAGAPTGAVTSEPRLVARIAKHPTGERPRAVASASLGGGNFGGVPPDASVDEVSFFTPRFGAGFGGANPAYSTQGGSLVLAEAMDAEGTFMRVLPGALRLPHTTVGSSAPVLSSLPQDGGLLRVGQEILAYESLSAGDGTIVLAAQGRGLLGTEPQPHAITEPVAFLEWWPVSILQGGVGPQDALLALADLEGFPQEGTVLVDQELIHYTRQFSGGLDMPRLSEEPGAMDEGGPGMFRGRFGTVPAGHAGGAPVILFPFRYWDRWQERADAPELAYQGLEVSQPGAFWESWFYEIDPSGFGDARIGVLVRTDPRVPWDADPETTEGLDLVWGDGDDGELPLGRGSDRIEWRVFVNYGPGAFDPRSGAAHGWRETPRLQHLGVTFTAPGRVLGSLDR